MSVCGYNHHPMSVVVMNVLTFPYFSDFSKIAEKICYEFCVHVAWVGPFVDTAMVPTSLWFSILDLFDSNISAVNVSMKTF